MAVMKLFRMRISHDTSMAYDPHRKDPLPINDTIGGTLCPSVLMLKSPVADPGLSISKSLLFAPGFALIKVV